jgi:hypothetical protein
MLRSCDSFSVQPQLLRPQFCAAVGGSDKGRVAVDAVHPAEHPSQGSRLHLQELFLLQLGQQLVHPERKEMSIAMAEWWGIEAVLIYRQSRLDLHDLRYYWIALKNHHQL